MKFTRVTLIVAEDLHYQLYQRALVTGGAVDWMELRAGTAVAPIDIKAIVSTWRRPRLDAAFPRAFLALRAVFCAAGSVCPYITPEICERSVVICASAVGAAGWVASCGRNFGVGVGMCRCNTLSVRRTLPGWSEEQRLRA